MKGKKRGMVKRWEDWMGPETLWRPTGSYASSYLVARFKSMLKGYGLGMWPGRLKKCQGWLCL